MINHGGIDMSMPVPKYKTGDIVFTAARIRQKKHIQCPDCLGQKTWIVTAPSGETWEAGCRTCERGYEGSLGVVERWEVDNHIEQLTIGSVRIDTAAPTEEVVSYMCVETGVGSGNVYYEGRLHPTRDAAQQWCLVEGKRQADEENTRYANLEKDRKKRLGQKPTIAEAMNRAAHERVARGEKP